MFNNWVNADDFVLVARRIRKGGLKRILRRGLGSRQVRIETSWRKSEIPPTHWWDIPEVVERWKLKIPGSPDQDFNDYVLLSSQKDLLKFLFPGTSMPTLTIRFRTMHLIHPLLLDVPLPLHWRYKEREHQ